MGSLTRYFVWGAVVAALLYQNFLRDVIYIVAGYGRELQPVEDFPYECRRVVDSAVEGERPHLRACEDMWLSESTRQLFLACSDPATRKQWLPTMLDHNAAGRSTADRVVALDIDHRDDSGGGLLSFPLRVLETRGLDTELHLVGFTGSESDGPGGVELLFGNQKPEFDSVTGQALDEVNSTVEHFRVVFPESSESSESSSLPSHLQHLSTYAHSTMVTPNRVAFAPTDVGGFFFTNDHGPSRSVWARTISPHIGTGTVTYCDTSAGTDALDCYPVSGGHRFPNGLVTGVDGLVYVPSSMKGTISVYNITKTTKGSGKNKVDLDHLVDLPIGYPLDNIAVSRGSGPSHGELHVAAFPKAFSMFADQKAWAEELLQSSGSPEAAARRDARALARKGNPGTLLRVRRLAEDEEGTGRPRYDVTKVLEDREGSRFPVPLTTTGVRDAKTGRVFLAGIESPYITVCEPITK